MVGVEQLVMEERADTRRAAVNRRNRIETEEQRRPTFDRPRGAVECADRIQENTRVPGT